MDDKTEQNSPANSAPSTPPSPASISYSRNQSPIMNVFGKFKSLFSNRTTAMAAVLLLVVGVGAGIIATQNSTEIRQRASNEPTTQTNSVTGGPLYVCGNYGDLDGTPGITTADADVAQGLKNNNTNQTNNYDEQIKRIKAHVTWNGVQDANSTNVTDDDISLIRNCGQNGCEIDSFPVCLYARPKKVCDIGDLDNDQKITMIDNRILLDYVLNLNPDPTKNQPNKSNTGLSDDIFRTKGNIDNSTPITNTTASGNSDKNYFGINTRDNQALIRYVLGQPLLSGSFTSPGCSTDNFLYVSSVPAGVTITDHNGTNLNGITPYTKNQSGEISTRLDAPTTFTTGGKTYTFETALGCKNRNGVDNTDKYCDVFVTKGTTNPPLGGVQNILFKYTQTGTVPTLSPSPTPSITPTVTIAPTEITLTATPENIPSGGSSTIAWNGGTGATSCSVSNDVATTGFPATGLTGSKTTGAITQSRTFTLNCNYPTDPRTKSKSVTVNVGRSISGVAFVDSGSGGGTANDCVQNGTETGLAGVGISAAGSAGGTLSSGTNDSSGNFRFNIPSTPATINYTLSITSPTGYSLNSACNANVTVSTSNPNPTVKLGLIQPIPDCNTTPVCTGTEGTCKLPANTCTGAGTRTCTYTKHTFGPSVICNTKVFTESCTGAPANCVAPKFCNASNACVTPTGTMPTATTGPTATTAPGTTAAPTATGTPGTGGNGTKIALVLGLDGIGAAGDNTNKTDSSTSTNPPHHLTRDVSVEVYDAQNALTTKTGTVTYNTTSKLFTGTVDLGVVNGNYTIKVKIDGHLKRRIPGIITFSAQAQEVTAPRVDITAGDIDNSNILNVADYTILKSCSPFASSTGACTDANGALSDLNDDGIINLVDFNLFRRELKNQYGD